MAVAHLVRLDTSLTCNCLLAKPSSNDGGDEAMPTATLHAACYELFDTSASSTLSQQRQQQHGGSVTRYMVDVHALLRTSPSSSSSLSLQHAPAPVPQQQAHDGALPGIFDIQYTHASPSSSSSSCALLAACTDGSVRVLDAVSLCERERYADVHTRMLTSCTPLTASSSSSNDTTDDTASSSLLLLCTAHGGDVLLYDTATRRVRQRLQSHAYDAWCSAAMPVAVVTRDDSRRRCCHDSSGSSAATHDGACGMVVTSTTYLLSGGDDGQLLLHDARVPQSAVWRTRFDAGVVSIAPVVRSRAACCAGKDDNDNNDDGGHDGHTTRSSCRDVRATTPHVLVGCYDESVSLVDVRSTRGVLAQRGRLGGGVWRVSRTLRPLRHACGASGCVDEDNVLVLPLMHGGAALLAYDTRTADVFGQPLHFAQTQSTRDGACDGDAAAAAAPSCLVYDTAVLSCMSSSSTSSSSSSSSCVVATCSFYERRIDVWRVPLPSSSPA